jgi:hypothetical protein
VLYQGVLAPNASWRARVVTYGAPVGAPTAASASADANDEQTPAPTSRHSAGRSDEARVRYRRTGLPAMRRTNALIATVGDPDAIHAIVAAVAVSRERADRAPPFAAALDTSLASAIST